MKLCFAIKTGLSYTFALTNQKRELIFIPCSTYTMALCYSTVRVSTVSYSTQNRTTWTAACMHACSIRRRLILDSAQPRKKRCTKLWRKEAAEMTLKGEREKISETRMRLAAAGPASTLCVCVCQNFAGFFSRKRRQKNPSSCLAGP